MEDEEKVLSDVHVCFPFQKNDSNHFAYTRFHIRCDLDDDDDDDGDDDDMNHESDKSNTSISCDAEGDYMIKRQRNNKYQSCEVITIEHQLATGLKDVGLQVWRGALLMADFIINNEQIFKGCYGLELGAGVGLCSIVLGRVASRVFCTDISCEGILKNCQRNVEINSHIYRNAGVQGDSDVNVVKVKQLDWKKDHLDEDKNCRFSWTEEDKDELDKVTVLIAADVIYDDCLTDALFKQVLYFFSKKNKKDVTFYLAIEKRLNFTLEFLEISCPAYNHYIKRLKILESENILQSRKITTSFKQYLEYERVKELELWEIKAC